METNLSKLTEQDKVFDKLYLFNLLNKTSFQTYHEAKNSIYFRTYQIIEKLSYGDIKYLVEKIENLY